MIEIAMIIAIILTIGSGLCSVIVLFSLIHMLAEVFDNIKRMLTFKFGLGLLR